MSVSVKDGDTALDRLMAQREKIRNGHTKLGPGQPVRFSEAAVVNDCYPQGDVDIFIAAGVPENYVKVEKLETMHRRLVPGNEMTLGSQHILDSLDGVELFYPKNWNASEYEGSEGPYMLLSQERTVEHPEHGSVTIPAGFCVGINYQREYDNELKRERRARD